MAENVARKVEFRLIDPAEGMFLKRIEWNRAELEGAIREIVSEYSGIAYTEETIKDAKADRAELNKLLKDIEDRRKQVKKAISEPYAMFEAELKEITSLIKSQVAEIDEQISEFEEREKAEKREKILAVYEKEIGSLRDVLPFEKVFDPRMLNKTYKLKDAVADVHGMVVKVKTDLDTIDGLCSDKYRLNAKDVYVKTLDLSKAMAEEKRLRELEEKMEADRIQKEEADRIAREKAEAESEAAEEEQAPEPEEPQTEIGKAIHGIDRQAYDHATAPTCCQPGNAVDVFGKDQDEKPAPAAADEKTYKASFTVYGTKDQIMDLKQYMIDNNIKFGKVEK